MRLTCGNFVTWYLQTSDNVGNIVAVATSATATTTTDGGTGTGATCSWCFWWHMRRLEAFVALFVWHNLNNWKFYAYAHNAMHRTATAEWPDADGWGMHMHMHIHIHIHHPASTSSILRPFGSCLVALMSKLQASHHCLILWPATWEWN